MSVAIIIAILMVLFSLGYLVWWGRRLLPRWRAKRLAARAARQTEWPSDLVEKELEYARLLDPRSAEFTDVCIGLAQQNVDDPRARALFERYLSVQRVSPENAVVARRLAQLISPKPVDERRAPEASNASSLLDCLIEMGLETRQDVHRRAYFARLWTDVSTAAIRACLKAWGTVRGPAQVAYLTRFLYDYFAAFWENKEVLSESVRGEFVGHAANVFCAMTENPPVSLSTRLHAIQATYEIRDHSACLEQCALACMEFGAPALNDDVWVLWAACVVQLEGNDWVAFARGEFSHLPREVGWGRLQEIMDRAAALRPHSDQFLRAQVWTYLGANIPAADALPVYERVLGQEELIVPALEKLIEHYHREEDWSHLERACRLLLPLQEPPAAARTSHWLAEALIEGDLPLDYELLQQAFDDGPSYPALNLCLAEYYLHKESLSPGDLKRIDRLLDSSLPAQFPEDDIQSLRERFSLAWLDSGEAISSSLEKHVTTYLETGGRHPRLMRWMIDADVGSPDLRLPLLEELTYNGEPPVERRYCLKLAEHYAQAAPAEEQIRLLAQAAESIWQTRSEFDADDCRLAMSIREHIPLSAETKGKLFVGLLNTQPDSWREHAESHLAEALEQDEADRDVLYLALKGLFCPEQPHPLHVRALEALLPREDDPVGIGLRLLPLYDAGVVWPGESTADAQRKADALAVELAEHCRQAADRRTCERLFHALLKRMMAQDVTELEDWEHDLLVFGLNKTLVRGQVQQIRFAEQVAARLAARGDERAMSIQRWAYEHGRRRPADAAQLFGIAYRFKRTQVGDPFWFEVARSVRPRHDLSSAANSFLAEVLLAQEEWDKAHAAAAYDLLDSTHRQCLAAVFVDRVEFKLNPKFDRKRIELLDEAPRLGAGRPELLLPLSDWREKRKDYDGALQACLLVEETIGSSEALTRRILSLLPNCSDRSQHAHRLAEYRERYRNSFDLLAQMVTLARDPDCPLSFDLAYRIADRWGDLAGTEGIVDPSFVAVTKCEIYELYSDRMTTQEAQTLLRSISKHSRQALSDEARRRIEHIGDEVLMSSGQANETRQIVAEILYGLGNLAAATQHFERLAEDPEYHSEAVESLRGIARRLESPRRELAALLTAYRCIAEDAHKRGVDDLAEETVKKAKAILEDDASLEELTEKERKWLALQRDEILKLHQALLETHREEGRWNIECARHLGDVYRLRGLWDKAGELYTGLAESYQASGDRDAALECAELVFDCYYRAGKGWWRLAARYLLRILWGREVPPPEEQVEDFGERELRLLESVAVLYHSLSVDESLNLDRLVLMRLKRNARRLYERLPVAYIQRYRYVRDLHYDLDRTDPTIEEPFELVPHMHERGRTEVWSGTRYEKLDRLGGGEFADVYKVKDTQTGEIYAMKSITPGKALDPQAVERFQREGAWLKDMDHPGIVRCYDVGVQEDRQFIIMDYVAGQTLDDWITRRRHETPLDERLRVFLDVCGAVEFLHNQSILHRDLHPGNVLIGDEAPRSVKLTDFGLATMMDREGVGQSSRIHGRENYTPPEVFAGERETIASEVYSLGAILCFVLSGWPHPDATLLRELQSPAYCGLGTVIERALSIAPSKRYWRVTELIQEVSGRAGMEYDYSRILQRVTPRRFKQMFELGTILGQGDAGKVYRAHDLRAADAPDVAIKEIASDRVGGSLERRTERFYRVRDLSHPNIVQLETFFRMDGRLYVVMDLVEGHSLADHMDTKEEQGKRFPPDESLQIVSDVARALAFVHQQSIVHGCVVPTNILLEAATRQAKLSDFAASVLFDAEQWHKSALVRQYNYYLAPEIARSGTVSPASDVYSLGWLLCHIVTGQRGQMTRGEIFAALDEMGRWTEEQMEKIVRIIQESTALQPTARGFETAESFLAAMETLE